MNKVNAIIIDDEPSCVETLSLLLNDYHPDVNLVAAAGSAEEGLKMIDQHKDKLDVVFLDIQMPGADGFSLLRQIPEITFKVVFTTAYDKFAIKAIKFSALDYLLKPIDNDELKEAISRFYLTAGRDDQYGGVNEFKNMLTQSRDLFERIAVNTPNTSEFITIEDILYMKSDNNYTTIHAAGKNPIVSSKNLGYYEDLLSNHPFCRVHNSYLVNLKKVAKYHKGKTGELELQNGVKLEISVRRKDEVLAKLGLN